MVCTAVIEPFSLELKRSSNNFISENMVGERNYDLSVKVQAILQKHESLKGIIAIIGENELSPDDRADFARARALISFFSQSMFVTEQITGKKGIYIAREETLRGVEAILKGSMNA